MTPTPLFIFSPMRSGSTLLQRVLATSPEVATVSEPWVLLPQIYARRRRGLAADYIQPLFADALDDFCSSLPDGAVDYDDSLREFMLDLYSKAARNSGKGEARYFLDKTPPYYLIVDEVMALFPEGKSLFLWRNPLNMLASIMEWGGDRWDPRFGSGHLLDGLPKLVATWERNQDVSCAIRYEDLIGPDRKAWTRMASYLELEIEPDALIKSSDGWLVGRMGDQHRDRARDATGTDSRWRRTLTNPLRRAWADRYLRYLGQDLLDVMGYDLGQLRAELASPEAGGREHALADGFTLLAAALQEPFLVAVRRSIGLDERSAFRHLRGRPPR